MNKGYHKIECISNHLENLKNVQFILKGLMISEKF